MATISDPRTPKLLLDDGSNSFDCETSVSSQQNTIRKGALNGREKCSMVFAFGASLMLGFLVLGPVAKTAMGESGAVHHQHGLRKASSKFFSPAFRGVAPHAVHPRIGAGPATPRLPVTSEIAIGRHVGRGAGVTMKAGQIQVTGIHTTVTEAMQEYAITKLSKGLERYQDLLDGKDIDVQLKVEHRGQHESGQTAHIAELTANVKSKGAIHATATSENMYASIDELSQKVNRQLQKYKEKSHGHGHVHGQGKGDDGDDGDDVDDSQPSDPYESYEAA
jgi:putative sigma-54 modulation protein